MDRPVPAFPSAFPSANRLARYHSENHIGKVTNILQRFAGVSGGVSCSWAWASRASAAAW